MIKAVLFDFFGVLHPDTFWGLADVFVPDRDDKKKRALGDLITRVDFGMISREEFWEQAADEFEVTIDELMQQKDKLGHVDERLLGIVKELKQQGIKTGILSNVGHGFVEQALDKQQQELFDVYALSGEVGAIKPDSRIYEFAAEKLGLPIEQCLFFDDVDRNVQGAVVAGMQSVQYEGIASCKKALAEAGVQV